MYIYNSLTNKKEEFKPIEPNKIKIYVCGPTVYNYIHIGNARPVIFFDVVRRYFIYRGYEVQFVSNITDVDDKIIKAALDNNVSETEITQKYEQAFLENVKQLNCLPYDINPHVTDYIPNIIRFIEELEKAGYAYEVDGDVYFSVSDIEGYGQLSNQETEHLEVGARITEHSKKKNPLDFTLWKKTDVGIQWDSPWGKGRPGWHTECVVMINDTLGKLIDIHGGGTDLIFPHHENEIAQSMALNKTHLANYWMHNGRLMIDNEKMSKSLGNFVLLKDLLEKYEYQVIRLFMLSTHYRQPLNYTPESIENAKNEAEKIRSSFSTLQLKLDYYRYLDKDIQALEESYIKAFYEAMDDDFNTANAITVIMNLMKEANVLVRKQDFTEVELEKLLKLYNTFKLLLSILGIEFNIIRLDDETRDLINKRNEARKTKDYETADKIRAILQEKGITI